VKKETFQFKDGGGSRRSFPDLDGLAKGLWQTEVIRHGKKK
jgi:hypothetical protein